MAKDRALAPRPDLLPTEHEEQVALFNWVRTVGEAKWPELALLFAIPNAGRMGGHKGKLWGARLKKEGLKAGVPDLFLPVARRQYYGLFLEMKRAKGGKLSADQLAWRNALRDQGYCSETPCGVEEAIAMLMHYLETRS